MDPILILVASIFAILLASLIVNLYYICRHYFYHPDYTTTLTQMFQNPHVHNEIQTETCSHVQDKGVQNTRQTETTGTDPQNLKKLENCIQTDKVYYITLLEQLDHISKQLAIKDLTRCMEWVGECEQTTLAAAHAIDQQTQLLQNLHDSIQQDLRQELQKYCTNILQDVQFQLNLLAETFEQNRLAQLRHQEAQ